MLSQQAKHLLPLGVRSFACWLRMTGKRRFTRYKLKLISVCLLGVACRYDEASKPCQKVLDLAKKEVLMPVCLEQLGGLLTPKRARSLSGAFISTKGDFTP